MRELEIADVSTEYIDNLNDRDRLRFSRNGFKEHSFHSQEVFIESFSRSTAKLFGIFHEIDGCLIGTVSAYASANFSSVNIGILIFESFANRGYGTEVLTSFTNFCLIDYGALYAIVGMDNENYGMARIAEKSGFSRLDDEKALEVGMNAPLNSNFLYYFKVKS